MAREYNRWETRLVTEWAVAERPDAECLFNVRLGDIPPVLGAETMPDWVARMLGNSRRKFADLVVVGDRQIELVEAKMRAAPIALGELLVYRRLLPYTPELVGRARLPIQPVLLYAYEDTETQQEAEAHGIRCIRFTPDWTEAWVRKEAARGHAVDVLV